MTDAAVINAFYQACLIAQPQGIDIGFCPEDQNILVTDKENRILKQSKSILEILAYLQDEFEDT